MIKNNIKIYASNSDGTYYKWQDEELWFRPMSRNDEDIDTEEFDGVVDFGEALAEGGQAEVDRLEKIIKLLK